MSFTQTLQLFKFPLRPQLVSTYRSTLLTVRTTLLLFAKMKRVSRAATKTSQLLNVRVWQDVLDDGMTVLMTKDIAPLSASYKSMVFFPHHLKFMPTFIVVKADRLLFMCPFMLLQQVGIMFDGK